jgi:hypothetical protein
VVSRQWANYPDYLVPTYLSGGKKDGWAFVNIGIGANDIVGTTAASYLLTPSVHSA